jgi:1,4-alpha-glucan branching enzyme
MISQMTTRAGAKVTFTVAAKTPVSVVGDFNGWDPSAHPMTSRSGGTRTVTIALTPGAYAFRYLAHGGLFFDEPDADHYASNAHGGVDNVVVVAEGTPPVPRSRPAVKKAAAPAKKAANAVKKK